MSALSIATAVAVIVFPGAVLADAPHLAIRRAKIRHYCREAVVDLVVVTLVLWVGILAQLTPLSLAACLSVTISVTKIAWVTATCISGQEVKQPSTLLGEARLCGVFLLCIALLGFEIFSPFLLLTSLQ